MNTTSVAEQADWISQHQLIIGWFMGAVSAPIGNWLYSFVERYRFLSTVRVELKELRFRIAASTFSLAIPIGELNRPNLTSIQFELETYRDTPEKQRLLQAITGLLNQGDAALAAANAAAVASAKAKSAPDIVMPYLEAHTAMIGLMSARRQIELVNLLHQIAVYNGKNREMAEWLKLTFSTGSGQNYTNAVQNINMCIRAMFTAGKEASYWIGKLSTSTR